MNATMVAVDLAKNVFELVAADQHWNIVERARLTRSQFQRWFHNRDVALVVMEACGSAHYRARLLQRVHPVDARIVGKRPIQPLGQARHVNTGA